MRTSRPIGFVELRDRVSYATTQVIRQLVEEAREQPKNVSDGCPAHLFLTLSDEFPYELHAAALENWVASPEWEDVPVHARDVVDPRGAPRKPIRARFSTRIRPGLGEILERLGTIRLAKAVLHLPRLRLGLALKLLRIIHRARLPHVMLAVATSNRRVDVVRDPAHLRPVLPNHLLGSTTVTSLRRIRVYKLSFPSDTGAVPRRRAAMNSWGSNSHRRPTW